MFAGEVAMDEMALACGLDPIEFRLRNEPDTDPDSGKPFSSGGRTLAGRHRSRRRHLSCVVPARLRRQYPLWS